MTDRTCYVYELRDRETGMWYVGSRTGAGCHPDDLGESYFTSSAVVSPLFRSSPDRFERRVLFLGTAAEVLAEETRVLMERDARNDPASYNMHNSHGEYNPVKSGRRVAAENRRLGRGLFAQTPEQRRAAGRAGGKKAGPRGGRTQGVLNAKNGVLERARAAIDWGKVSRLVSERLSRLTPEERSRIGKLASAKNWRCAECGMAANAGNIGYHQKASGHRGRIKNDA